MILYIQTQPSTPQWVHSALISQHYHTLPKEKQEKQEEKSQRGPAL